MLAHLPDDQLFRLDPSFIAQYAGRQPPWGYGGLSYLTFKRTYARPVPVPVGATEEWWQTVCRFVEGTYQIQQRWCVAHRLPWDAEKAQRSAQEMYRRAWDFRFTPPGRGLWMMGTDFAVERSGAALNNCGFISTENIAADGLAEPFCWLMEMAMLGVGVGLDTRGKDTLRLAAPTIYGDHIIDDSREGWVEVVRRVLNPHAEGTTAFMPGRFDFSRVRPRGAPIKGFGGVASGATPLAELVCDLVALLRPEGHPAALHIVWEGGEWDGDTDAWRELPFAGARPWSGHDVTSLRVVDRNGHAPARPITSAIITDIANYIGKCVVAGGVRRTAEIVFGDHDDAEFAALKRDKAAKADRRWASNNSIFAHAGMDYAPYVDTIAKDGEPGFFWLDHARDFSRMGDPPDHKDHRVKGGNPCLEQSLESYELCCLVETFPARHESLLDYLTTLKYAYLYAKTVTLVPTHDARTNAVIARNRRIGCSMSGIVQLLHREGRDGLRRWCEEGYQTVQRYDEVYSGWLGVRRSIKTTSVKPSGTVSILAGATPGIHYPHAPHYIRRIRIASTSPLWRACEAAGYEVEDDVVIPHTKVVSFPIAERDCHRAKADVSLREQFELAALMQGVWADNQVSCTAHFKESEVDQIAPLLSEFDTRLKGISLLPLENPDYAQLPYEAITRATYEAMSARLRPLNLSGDTHDQDDLFCDGDACALPQPALVQDEEAPDA